MRYSPQERRTQLDDFDIAGLRKRLAASAADKRDLITISCDTLKLLLDELEAHRKPKAA